MFRQSFCGFSCDRISIGIQHMSLFVVCKGSQYRNNTLMNQGCQQIRIHLFHITDKTVVHLSHRTFVRPHQIHIRSGQSQRIYT